MAFPMSKLGSLSWGLGFRVQDWMPFLTSRSYTTIRLKPAHPDPTDVRLDDVIHSVCAPRKAKYTNPIAGNVTYSPDLEFFQVTV